MCLATSNIRGAAQWNWEGDTIIHDPIIVGCRDVLGTKKKKRYDIDIRGFLASKDNAVLKRTVRQVAAGLPPPERALFYYRATQSFDFRVRAITAFISERVAYKKGSSRGWDGKIISGRFGQQGDQAQSFLEKTFISIPYALRSAAGFERRTCLPHHNEIAVDAEKKPDGHKLYDDPEKFKKAYELRRTAAVAHSKKIYQEWLVVKAEKEKEG